MKTHLVTFTCLLAGLWLATSCNKKNDTSPCKAPGLVTVDTACYSGNGLLLTASDYGDSPLSFEWDIYALKDTSGTVGWSPKDEKIRMIASNTFMVPDSLVTNYSKLIVNVATNCQGILYHSITYGFVKHKSTATNCTTWRRLNN